MYDIEPIRAAILRRAALDYVSALKKRDTHKMVYLERFLLGAWGQLLSYGHGEYIIANCKRIVNNKQNIRKNLEIAELL